ncbi:MAG: hypothetical protein RR410_02155 [Alistipes sp.]
MKLRYFSFLLLLFACQPAGAADRAEVILEQLSAGFRTMKSYGVQFEVVAGEYTTKGSYSVEGENYNILLGDAEVFCDGKVRYEVDKRRKEITINEVDASSRNILNNPVHAFDFLGSEFAAALLWERDGKAAVRLIPTASNNASAGEITVTVSTAAMLPVAIEYNYDGERIVVTVASIASLSAALKHFNKANYAGYEWIDFR